MAAGKNKVSKEIDERVKKAESISEATKAKQDSKRKMYWLFRLLNKSKK